MISIIIPVKARLYHLKQSLPKLFLQTFKDLEIIVVDYNCRNLTFQYLTDKYVEPRLKPVMAEGVGFYEWNLSAARNIGFRKSVGDVLVFIDADSMLNKRFLQSSLDRLGSGDNFLTGGEIDVDWKCSGCCVVRREHFVAVKGYNEAMIAGWGSEDINLYDRLQAHGLRRDLFDLNLIRNIQHDDRMRNEFHDKRGGHDTNAENYEIAKTEFKGL